jgi:hypothetical protein|tara:strand:+ start:1005 stop:1751 length:747 start_codon:yes stop_codon:yes gene_type:complete
MKMIKIALMAFLLFDLKAEEPRNILFVGNSYLYYNNSVHNYVEFMLREFYGSDIDTKLSAIGGSRLHHHNIDHLLDFRNLNLDQQIDLLIMQGGSAQVKTKQSQKEFVDTVQNYAKKAQDLGIATALYMTHAYTDTDERYEPNLINKITETYNEAGKSSNSFIIPVGIAYELAYAEKPQIKLHHPDGTHPGLLGTYLAAATVVASVTDQSPVGIKFNNYGTVNEEDRAFLQKIAWQAYLAHKKEVTLD